MRFRIRRFTSDAEVGDGCRSMRPNPCSRRRLWGSSWQPGRPQTSLNLAVLPVRFGWPLWISSGRFRLEYAPHPNASPRIRLIRRYAPPPPGQPAAVQRFAFVCSSGQRFASGFLQIRSRPRHPCLWLTLPLAGCVEDFHLQAGAPCRAHHKKAPDEIARGPNILRVDPGLPLDPGNHMGSTSSACRPF